MEVRPPRDTPLTGGDYFLLALDRQNRNRGLAGNGCRLVLELDGALDVERLHSALNATGLGAWLAGARIRRRFPFALPRWQAADKQASLAVHEHAAGGTETLVCPLPPHVSEPILRPDQPPGIALDLVRDPAGGTRVVFRWHHALMDARGSELLIEHLNREETPARGSSAEASLHESVFPDCRTHRHRRGLLSRLKFARRSLFLIEDTGTPPVASLVSPECLRDGARSGFRLIEFTEEETRLIDNVADRVGAGFCQSVLRLAASMRAVQRVCVHRGRGSDALVVPVPQDRRRRGGRGPALSNHVTFLFYRVEPEQLESMARLVDSLKSQMISQMRERLPQSFAVAMDLFRRVPLWLYSHVLGRPTEGRMASLFFSDIGENFPCMERFLGCEVLRIAHLPPVTAPPGVAVIAGRFRQRLYLVVSWVEGGLSIREQEIMEQSIREDLLTGGRE